MWTSIKAASKFQKLCSSLQFELYSKAATNDLLVKNITQTCNEFFTLALVWGNITQNLGPPCFFDQSFGYFKLRVQGVVDFQSSLNSKILIIFKFGQFKSSTQSKSLTKLKGRTKTKIPTQFNSNFKRAEKIMSIQSRGQTPHTSTYPLHSSYKYYGKEKKHI